MRKDRHDTTVPPAQVFACATFYKTVLLPCWPMRCWQRLDFVIMRRRRRLKTNTPVIYDRVSAFYVVSLGCIRERERVRRIYSRHSITSNCECLTSNRNRAHQPTNLFTYHFVKFFSIHFETARINYIRVIQENKYEFIFGTLNLSTGVCVSVCVCMRARTFSSIHKQASVLFGRHRRIDTNIMLFLLLSTNIYLK